MTCVIQIKCMYIDIYICTLKSCTTHDGSRSFLGNLHSTSLTSSDLAEDAVIDIFMNVILNVYYVRHE